MDQSAQNPSQSTPFPPARKSAMSDPISIPVAHLEKSLLLGQALAQFLISEANAGMANPSQLTKLPHTSAPLAFDMSDTEVSAVIANAVDPWSMDQHGGERPQSTSLPVQTLLTAMEFGAMFATDADAAPLFAPGAVSVFVVDDPRQRTRVVDSSDELIAVLRQMPYFAQADGDSLRLISSQTLSSRNFGQKPTDMRRTFHKEIDTAIAAGDVLVVICDHLDALSDVARTVDFTTYVWPTLSAAMILTLLKQTHSATGQIAEDVIADILPTNAGLASIPPTLFNHAFRAASSVAVAQRLARYETPVVSKPLGLTLSSVKGLPQVCSTLTDMISDLKDWEAGKVAWSDVSASALFYGPPGTGKTMLAEAVAGSAGAHYVATSYTDLQSAGHLGDYLKAMAEVVKGAIKNAPSVIFFDELDSFGSRSATSGGSYSRYTASVINDMLQQLTRLNAAEGVIVLAATNYIENIDPAIIRSGRFDAKIAVPYPDKQGARDILAHRIGSGTTVEDDVINRLLGLSGADLALVARDAKGRARRERSPVKAQHLQAATTAAVPLALDTDLERIAAHEAGHIVMAAALDMPLPFSARIAPSGGAVTRLAPTLHTPKSIKNELAYFMAGRAAEEIMCGEISSGSGADEQSDLDKATAMAIAQERQWGLGKSGLFYAPVDSHQRHLLTASQQHTVNERLKAAESLAVRTLTQNGRLLGHVTEALLEKRELDSLQIRILIDMEDGTMSSSPMQVRIGP